MEQRKFFDNGEMIIKTEEGVFFHALSEEHIPLSIDEDEGEKEFSKAKYRLSIYEEQTYHDSPRSVIDRLSLNAPFEISGETMMDVKHLEKNGVLELAERDVFVVKQN